jgi:predicted membrane chloride channel (bestrophin family)
LTNYGEESRKYRRNVFSAADWVRSRRPERFLDNILTTFDSGLIRQLQYELIFIAVASAFIVVWNDLFVAGYTDFSGVYHDRLVDFIPALQLPLAPFSLSIASLGLLLTFRTNISYGRWNEARTAWGKVINDSRSIMRMGCIWAKSYNNIDDAQLQRLGEAVCSFSRSLMSRTLPPQEDEQNFKDYLATRLTDQKYAVSLRDAKHRPTAALAEISSIIVDFKLNPIHQVEVEKVITGLCDALGASERIFTSPVPTFYTRHTARFLAFWLLALPTGLYEPFAVTWNHWAVIPVVVVLSGFLLGIEELATQMEEPFSILPMEKMCEGSIRISVMEQVERSKTGNQGINGAQPVAPAAFSSGIPSTNGVKSVSPGSLSEQDREKIELYFEEEEEKNKGAGNQGINGGINGASALGQWNVNGMSVAEMNKLWASQSGSKS